MGLFKLIIARKNKIIFCSFCHFISGNYEGKPSNNPSMLCKVIICENIFRAR